MVLSWLLDVLRRRERHNFLSFSLWCGGKKNCETPVLASASVFELLFAEKKAQKNH